MVPVRCHTHIDGYKSYYFPDMLTGIPHVGEYVSVCDGYSDMMKELNLPLMLQVQRVEYYEDKVCVELHYDEFQLKMRELSSTGMIIRSENDH